MNISMNKADTATYEKGYADSNACLDTPESIKVELFHTLTNRCHRASGVGYLKGLARGVLSLPNDLVEAFDALETEVYQGSDEGTGLRAYAILHEAIQNLGIYWKPDTAEQFLRGVMDDFRVVIEGRKAVSANTSSS